MNESSATLCHLETAPGDIGHTYQVAADAAMTSQRRQPEARDHASSPAECSPQVWRTSFLSA